MAITRIRTHLWAIADNFEVARSEKNWLVTDLAREAGVSYHHAVRVVNGSYPTTIFSACKFCKALDKKMDYLFTRKAPQREEG